MTAHADRRSLLGEGDSLGRYLLTLLDATQEGMYGLDLEGRCTFINRAGAAMLGYAPEELMGRRMHEVIHHTRRDGSSCPSEECRVCLSILSGQGFRMDDELLWRKDGSSFDAECWSNPLVEGGRVTGAVALFADITDRKWAETALRERTRQLGAVVEALGFFVDGGQWAKASSRILGHALDQTGSHYGFLGVVVEGPALRVLVHEGVRWDQAVNREFYENARRTYEELGYLEFKSFDNLFGRVLTGGQAVLSNDPARDPRAKGLPPGHPPLLAFLGVPMIWQGRVVGMIGLANRPGGYTVVEQGQVEILAQAASALYEDYRRRERQGHLEAQLRQAQKMEAIGRLAGGVAHDFNNLLTVINGYSQVLLDGLPESAPGRAEIEQIGLAGQRAGRLTTQLLAFSRPQALHLQDLNLRTIVEDLGGMLRRLIGEHIAFDVRAGADLWPVKADPGQIEQVLINLAANARDAMPGGGRLLIEVANAVVDEACARRLGLAGPGRFVELAVSDTGVGMDADTQSHIFEPFFTTKGRGKGTGLGLATVYGIVTQNGGAVEVESVPGRGTAFRLYLPHGNPASVRRRTAAPVEAQPDGGETVLLVEDEPVVRALASTILKARGYRVIEAADGEAALCRSRETPGPIHLLLTDVIMPAMGGGALADRLLAARPDLRVLFMSGYNEDAIVQAGVRAGERALLTKPFTPTSLAKKVRAVLDEGGDAADV